MAAETGDNFTHFVSIDFGTSGCGIAMATKKNKSDIKLFTTWEGKSIEAKCPTVLLLDPEEKFEGFGVNAMTSYEKKTGLKKPDRADEYLLFQKFKMHLYDNPVRLNYTMFVCLHSRFKLRSWYVWQN